ncbi:MAG: iron permease FTR1, partial [Negativicutes bacterium]
MFVLAVSFTGGGIEALQEAGVVSMTLVEGIPVPTIDLLGIYPTYETLVPQLALILAAVITVFYKRRPNVSAA